MKKLVLISTLLFGGLVARGQAWINPLPIDSTTRRVVYTAVVEVPGVTKAELYSRAREWFATSFGSAKAVLEMDDREAGKLIGKANSAFVFDGVLPSTIWREIKVEIKDGKYRYSLSKFGQGVSGDLYGTDHPVENWFIQSKYTYNKDGSPKKMAASVIDATRTSAESEIASLRAAMSVAAKKEKDW